MTAQPNVALKAQPVMWTPRRARYEFRGPIGERIRANEERWLLNAPLANPAVLQMFRDRDRSPRRALVPWAGEFAGKYLTSAAECYRLTRSMRLRAFVSAFAGELASVQDADGYLGPHPQAERLTGRTHDGKRPLWDVWGHYHCILGLLAWWRETGDAGSLAVARRAGDYICDRFLDTGVRAISAGAEEMNLAIAHGMCLLYEATGEARYLRMAREVERDWETAPAGDYVRTALQGFEFFQTPKPRWESLHDIQALAELHFITGDPRYRDALLHIWRSIRGHDRHNTGAFSSAEKAVGNPYDTRAIETCCVIGWLALSIDALRLSGDPVIADEIELATLNAAMAAQHPSGRWWAYNTPMDGVRLASAHEIVFQAHQGSPELNCCSVNGPRALGMLPDWAFLRTADGVAVNFYGPCSARIPLGRGAALALNQETDYPAGGRVVITLSPAAPRRFALRLRVPGWSRATRVAVNGEAAQEAAPGSYLALAREWRDGDRIELEMDMSMHAWRGEREKQGLVSLYRGPVLLAYDQRFNPFDPQDVPAVRGERLAFWPERDDTYPPPWVLGRVQAESGRELWLCDFATAGARGTHYRSWLPLSEAAPGAAPSPFAVRLG